MTGWNPCKTPHIWEPCEGFSGRYKCAKCYTFGYHKLVTATDMLAPTGLHGSHRSNIVPYLCPKCHGPTTRKDRACLICKPKVENPAWKWVKIANGWAVVKDGYRIARVEYVRINIQELTKAWRITMRGKETQHIKDITLVDAKKIVEDALGLATESGTPTTEA